MRTSLDVLRSTKKYVGELALPDYNVRLASEEGTWERPFCRIGWSTPAVNASQGQLALQITRTLNVVVWPAEAASGDEAVLVAEGVVEMLTLAFAVGLHTPSYRPSSNRAHPSRIPIWDYDGKAFTDQATDADRDPRDFAWVVEPPSFDHLEDESTPRSRLVVGDVRLRWFRYIGVETPGEVVVTVGQRFNDEPQEIVQPEREAEVFVSQGDPGNPSGETVWFKLDEDGNLDDIIVRGQ